MGAWGAGLYANDLAMDLKATIASVVRLPLGTDELIKLLEDTYSEVIEDEDDDSYTSFWLVTADQFHKRGIPSARLFQRAFEIVDSGLDLKILEELEMSPGDLRKRGKVLQELRTRLAEPVAEKKRKTLKKPESFVVQAGDVFLIPLFAHNNCINPYFAEWSEPQEQWGAACIVKSTHIFDYLAVYQPLLLTTNFPLKKKPGFDEVLQATPWGLQRPGTCSKTHFARMKFEKIGQIKVDEVKLAKAFPEMDDGRSEAISDVSIANAFGHSTNRGTLNELTNIVAKTK
ncbi:hypothetical protein [Anatilimnocola floriformis]|uniref:hypothetical protein n=1 Tax=Anatilimnocola floriformis TaxID=2948575 RepID=UPI0020C442A0|nr:hypothetical protein [Anatilimnocola floriformis]